MKPAVLITLTRGCEQLAHALLERADVEIINLLPDMGPFYEAKGIPFHQFFDFIDDRRKTEAADEAAKRMAHLSNVFADPAFRREWPALSEESGEWDAFIAATEETLRAELLSAMLISDMLRRCAQEADLRLIVIQQEISRDTRTLAYAGRRLGIPSLHVLHGSPCGATAAINLWSPPSADMVAVFSESTRAVYESLGTPPDRIAVTGNFEWDVYAKPFRPRFREENCERLGLDPAKPVVTYALTYGHRFTVVSTRCLDYVNKTCTAVIQAFSELARRHPDWQFVVRPHPNDLEAADRIAAMKAESGLTTLAVDRELSAPGSVAITDAYVCCQSNMAVEALLTGKPAIGVALREHAPGFFDEGIGYMYPDDCAIVTVTKPDEIAPAIEAALTDPATQQQFLDRRPASIEWFNGSNDGNATERVVRLMLDMMERGCVSRAEVDREADYEAALARAVPEDAASAIVVGARASFLADLVRATRPSCDVEADKATGQVPDKGWPCVVLSDPVPHSGEATDVLRRARSYTTPGGALIAVFRHGGNAESQNAFNAAAMPPPRPGFAAASSWGQFSRQGIEISLSRAGFDVESMEEHAVEAINVSEGQAGSGIGPIAGVDAWIVTARAREDEASPRRRANDALQASALDANRKGETFFAAGRYEDAARCFREALRTWDRDPLTHNNLGAAFHALGRPDAAWDQFIEALHFDPTNGSARENLRALAGQLGRVDEADRILSVYGSDDAAEGDS